MVGPGLVVVGAVHTGLTVVLHRKAVGDILRAGVLDAVTADRREVVPRSLAFWFATAGIGMSAAGAVVTSLEHRPSPLPRSLPWALAGVGAWGAALLPRSPFWVLGVLAALAEVRRRRVRDALRADQQPRPMTALGRTADREVRAEALP